MKVVADVASDVAAPNRAGPAPALTRHLLPGVQALLDDVVAALSPLPDCVAIVLFGSAARGELHARSDLDLLVLLDVDHRPELGPESAEVSRQLVGAESRHNVPWPVSCVLARADLAGLDPDFVAWIAAEGVVLWTRPDFIMRLPHPDSRLEPYILITYEQAKLTESMRVRLHRALFGYRTTKTVNGKRYQSERPGAVQFPGQRLGPTVLFVPAYQDAAVRAVLDRHGVTYGRTPVWR